MRMRLRMLKHYVGKGRLVIKQLHVCLIVFMLQYYAIVATERAGYVLYKSSSLLRVATPSSKSAWLKLIISKIIHNSISATL